MYWSGHRLTCLVTVCKSVEFCQCTDQAAGWHALLQSVSQWSCQCTDQATGWMIWISGFDSRYSHWSYSSPHYPGYSIQTVYDMIHLLTAIGLSPGGSSTVHIYTQTIHRTTQNNNRTIQITTNMEECGPCPVFASFNLAFALQLRKKYWKISVRVRKTSVRVRKTSVRVRKTSVRVRKTSVRVQYTYYQNTHTHMLYVISLN